MRERKYSYQRMGEEERELIYKMFEEKVELRKIARIMNRTLSSIQYQLKKNS
jgi:IS30 family transposase